ncbi:hypothetical protein DUNSADRAFT_7392 [Dunaliella salina]|uniref:STI1/HOP DP domain-containing protein n=1 Tax=Dunaliella salina TaxID=3046 RepID=A0ABQ7H6B6_DUNSA|nr:hypothetical protein DUNSADRAFT_7392 [Dunaliella salina]|eukprot:KAF5842408.1 hypothetical protein DUNSADRAFT_7392 [Dunaliella salina]
MNLCNLRSSRFYTPTHRSNSRSRLPFPPSPAGSRHADRTKAIHVCSSSQQRPDSIQGVIAQLREDPVLRKVLDSPKMPKALNELQTNPAAAMERYGGDADVMGVLAKLTTFDMSPEQRKAIQGMGASPDDLARTIYSDRKLAASLQQPHIRAALAEFRTNPVAASAKYEGNKEVTEVLDLLEKSLSIEV